MNPRNYIRNNRLIRMPQMRFPIYIINRGGDIKRLLHAARSVEEQLFVGNMVEGLDSCQDSSEFFSIKCLAVDLQSASRL